MSRQPTGNDVWFEAGKRWCWRCWRFTKHMGHTHGRPVCVRCAIMRDGTEKDKGKKK